MKTKFTSLTKIRKQKVQECEQKVIIKNYEIAQTREKIETLYRGISQIETPKDGTFQEMLSLYEIKKSYTYEIGVSKDNLSKQEQQKKQLEKSLKEMIIEYEKAKHLEDVEIQRIIKERNRLEAERLNEIATILYNNKNRREE